MAAGMNFEFSPAVWRSCAQEGEVWYVIQTVGGQEQAARVLIERRLSGERSDLVEKRFNPMRK